MIQRIIDITHVLQSCRTLNPYNYNFQMAPSVVKSSKISHRPSTQNWASSNYRAISTTWRNSSTSLTGPTTMFLPNHLHPQHYQEPMHAKHPTTNGILLLLQTSTSPTSAQHAYAVNPTGTKQSHTSSDVHHVSRHTMNSTHRSLPTSKPAALTIIFYLHWN